MKNLLLISNISSSNKQLIEYAAKFCKYYACKLHILHIAENSTAYLVSSPKYYNAFGVEFKNAQAEKSIEQISKVTDGILDREFIQVRVQEENQNSILSNFLNANFIDLIIVGTPDLNVNSRVFDQKEILLNVVDTPIIVVPDFHVFEPFKTFNFLTTHTQNDINDIVKIVGLFPDAEVSLTHLVSNETVESVIQKSEKWLNYVKEKAGKNLDYQVIKQDLKKYVNFENKAIIKLFDAFVFTSHKRDFWARIFNPSTTLGFLSTLEIPAIIFKIKNSK